MTSIDNIRLSGGAHGKIRVRKLDSGRYQADAWYRSPNGTLKRVRRSATTKAGAAAALKEQLEPVPLPDIRTIGELLNEWLSRLQDVQLATRKTYKTEIDHYLIPRLGNVKLESISAASIQAALYDVNAKRSHRAAAQARGRINQACEWAVRLGILESNPATSTFVPAGTDRRGPTAPTDESVGLLKETLRADWKSERSGPRSPNPYLAAEIMAGTGARIEEVLTLMWEDIDFAKQTVVLRDTSAVACEKNVLRGHMENKDPRRTVHVGQRLVDILKEHRKDTGLVIANRNGEMVHANTIRRSWRTISRNAGIPEDERVRPQDLTRAVAGRITNPH